MAAGLFGYLGYDMVRQMEELPPPNPDPLGIPDAILMRPTITAVFDTVKDSITVVTPVWPENGVDAKTALARAAERLSGVVESLDRPLDKSPARGRCRAARRRRRSPTPRRTNISPWCARPRNISPPATSFRSCRPALRGALHAAAVFALSRAAAAQSVALSLFPRLRRLRGRRLQPGNSGARARRHGHHPAHRRHARRAARRRTKTRRWKKNCSPIRRNAPSI